nr:MAG TPA: hypothetical protein [Ackermannviridae sp.]
MLMENSCLLILLLFLFCSLELPLTFVGPF